MNARAYARLVAIVALLAFCLSPLCRAGGTEDSSAKPSKSVGKDAPKAFWVYVGTYNGPKSKGIYVLRLDLASGALSQPEVAAETINPTFLALHPSGKYLYAVAEIANFGGKKSGAVAAFAVTPSGKLTALNQQPSGGVGPCHVIVDREGKNVLAANYGSGSVGVVPIQPDGRLGELAQSVQHTGAGPNPKRQSGPHAHSVNLDPAGRFAFAADLGLDKVFIYRFDPAASKLTPNNPAFAQVAPGAGPRHLAFSPDGKFVYVINEMGCTITTFAYDAGRGSLKEVQTISTLPAGFTGQSTCAEVQVHPSGRFVYGSNRGHDSIAIFAADPQTGKLTAAGHESTRGKTPRGFGIDPTGAYLLVGNQGTDNLVLFRIDQKTGQLTPTGAGAEIGAPVCVKFLAAE